MNAPHRRLGWSLVTALTFAVVGCETAPTPPPPPSEQTPSLTPQQAAQAADAKAKEAEDKAKEADGKAKGENEVKSMPVETPKGAATDKLSDGEIAEIKKLPADEQPVALAQVVCPVSNNHLGDPNMGMPLKKTVAGKAVFLCCKGCEGDFDADPAKYLAKVEKK